MYQSFEAIIESGKIRPLESMKIPESAHVLVTIVDENSSHLKALLEAAEKSIKQKKTRPMKVFLKELKNGKAV